MSSSEVAEHIHIESPGHNVELSDVKILDRDQRYFERGVKEAAYIRAYQPSLNRHPGRHQLSHVYNNILRTRLRNIHPDVTSVISEEGCSSQPKI